MIGGSLGPITVGIDSGGPFNVGKMLQAAEHWPINFGFLGRGNSHKPASIVEQMETGCVGLKIHEDWGSMPATIDACLKVADELDFQVQLHTDTLERIRLRRGYARRHRRPHHPHVSHRRRRRRPRARHHPRRRHRQLPAVVDQSDQSLHGQHLRRTSRHDDGVPSSQSGDSGGRGIRRKPHPRADHRGRGRAARHRRDLDARLRQPGHGPHPRGDLPHLAACLEDEGPARAAAARSAPASATMRASAATSPNTPSTPRAPSASPSTSARWKTASWPTSSFGARPFSASSRSS